MKILVRLRNGNEYLGHYILEDKESIKEQVLEELEYKPDHYIETYFDSEDKMLKQRYVEIPKSEQELMHEEIEKLKRAIAENAPDTSELDTLKANKRLSKDDLSKLDNL